MDFPNRDPGCRLVDDENGMFIVCDKYEDLVIISRVRKKKCDDGKQTGFIREKK